MPTTRTYAELFAEIKALAGVSSFTTEEQVDIFNLTNRRYKEAYDVSPYWSRWLRISEERKGGYVMLDNQSNYSLFDVGDDPIFTFNAGGWWVNGARYSWLAEPEGSQYRWGLYDPSGNIVAEATSTVAISDLRTEGPWDYVGSFRDKDGAPLFVAGVMGQNVSATPTWIKDRYTFGVDEWTERGGTKARIGQVIRADKEPWLEGKDLHPINLVGTRYGYRVRGYTDYDTLYITYQEELTLLTSVNDEVPGEFFSYLAQAVYADFLRMDGQTDKANAEEAKAVALLTQELEKLDMHTRFNSVRPFFRTHTSTQSRNY